MPELVGDVRDRRIAREQQAREGVTQIVDPERGKAGSLQRGAKHPADLRLVQRVLS
jgi:hypothetical protein